MQCVMCSWVARVGHTLGAVYRVACGNLVWCPMPVISLPWCAFLCAHVCSIAAHACASRRISGFPHTRECFDSNGKRCHHNRCCFQLSGPAVLLRAHCVFGSPMLPSRTTHVFKGVSDAHSGTGRLSSQLGGEAHGRTAVPAHAHGRFRPPPCICATRSRACV